MTTVEEIVEAAKELSDEELRRLLALLEEIEADAWDRQIEEDIKSGRLDTVLDEVRREHAAGNTVPLSQVIGE